VEYTTDIATAHDDTLMKTRHSGYQPLFPVLHFFFEKNDAKGRRESVKKEQ
jgi:hypothetical protein